VLGFENASLAQVPMLGAHENDRGFTRFKKWRNTPSHPQVGSRGEETASDGCSARKRCIIRGALLHIILKKISIFQHSILKTFFGLNQYDEINKVFKFSYLKRLLNRYSNVSKSSRKSRS